MSNILSNISPICRIEFQKFGDDLEYAKSRGDMDGYDNIAEQIKESYRRCGSVCFMFSPMAIMLREILKSYILDILVLPNS